MPLVWYRETVPAAAFVTVAFPVFLTFNVGRQNGLLRTFSSWRATLGNCQCAFQCPLGHYPLFLTYNVRVRIGLLSTLSSWRNTSGKSSDDSRKVIKVKWLIYRALRKFSPPWFYVSGCEIVGYVLLARKRRLWFMCVKCKWLIQCILRKIRYPFGVPDFL